MVTSVKLPQWYSLPISRAINNEHRLDVSAYNADAMKALLKVKQYKHGSIPLLGKGGIVKSAYYPGRYKRIYSNEQDGVPFYLPSQLEEIYPQPTKFIAPQTAKKLANDYIKANLLLMSRSGTIGKSTISSRSTVGKLFSDDVIRISFNNIYDLGYTYTFLNTFEGLNLLRSNNYGAVIDHIEPEHLRNIIIPNAPIELRQEIHNLIMQSFELRDRSNELIDNAQKLLFHELSLPPLSEIEPKQYSTNDKFRCISISASRLDGRLDVSYHVPEVEEIIDILHHNASRVLKIKDPEISKCIILPGRFKRVYVDKIHGVPFFGGKQLLQLTPSNVKYLSRTHHAKRIEQQLTVHENMCVISCSGTIGKVNIVPKHWDGWTLSQHVIRIMPSSNDIAGYIYAWLSSPYCKMLILRNSYGAVIDELSDDQIGNVRIPILKDTKKIQRINEDVLLANHLRYEAVQKEKEALALMQKILDNDI